MMSPRLVLASASPRRRALLEQIGQRFDVLVTDVDETVLPGELPGQYVERLARAKAVRGYQVWHAAGHHEEGQKEGERAGCIVLGADTTVTIDNEILGKPCGLNEGVAMLQQLSGRSHEVVTAVAVYDGERLESCVVTTAVHFRSISVVEAEAYWRTGEAADKAGGYGIQGIGGIFAERLEGSYSAVVGLPLEQTERLLRELAFDTWSTRIDGRRTPH